MNNINENINYQKCYYLDNVIIIDYYYYIIIISILSGIGSFFIGNYVTQCFYKLHNRQPNNNNNILIASAVN